MIDSSPVELEDKELIEVSKPLFYGYIFLAGITITVWPSYAGTLLGKAVLSAIAFVSAGLAEGMEEDWARFLEVISVSALLLVVLFSAYSAAILSMS